MTESCHSLTTRYSAQPRPHRSRHGALRRAGSASVRTLFGRRRHRPFADEDEESLARRVLPRDVSEAALRDARPAPDGPIDLSLTTMRTGRIKGSGATARRRCRRRRTTSRLPGRSPLPSARACRPHQPGRRRSARVLRRLSDQVLAFTREPMLHGCEVGPDPEAATPPDPFPDPLTSLRIESEPPGTSQVSL